MPRDGARMLQQTLAQWRAQGPRPDLWLFAYASLVWRPEFEVAESRRRRGLGLAVMAALLEWGAEQGARTAYLQVLGDNGPALGLYERLGFGTHHAYRYLASPVAPSAGGRGA